MSLGTPVFSNRLWEDLFPSQAFSWVLRVPIGWMFVALQGSEARAGEARAWDVCGPQLGPWWKLTTVLHGMMSTQCATLSLKIPPC